MTWTNYYIFFFNLLIRHSIYRGQSTWSKMNWDSVFVFWLLHNITLEPVWGSRFANSMCVNNTLGNCFVSGHFIAKIFGNDFSENRMVTYLMDSWLVLIETMLFDLNLKDTIAIISVMCIVTTSKNSYIGCVLLSFVYLHPAHNKWER